MDMSTELAEAVSYVNETNRLIGASVYYVHFSDGEFRVGGHWGVEKLQVRNLRALT